MKNLHLSNGDAWVFPNQKALDTARVVLAETSDPEGAIVPIDSVHPGILTDEQRSSCAVQDGTTWTIEVFRALGGTLKRGT